MKLLHLISSPSGKQSRTLEISNEFLSALKAMHPNLEITEIDLFNFKLPEVQLEAANAKYTVISGRSVNGDSKSVWQEITRISNQFLEYDIYLITSPMWNFTVPYKLKHYIDVIMQPGILFNFTATGVVGLAHNKKMFCISTRGSDYGEKSPMHQLDFQEPYLRAIFGLAGIYDITFVKAQPMDISPDLTASVQMNATNEAKSLAQNMAM